MCFIGKKAVIAGASLGIGMAVDERLSREDAQVLLYVSIILNKL